MSKGVAAGQNRTRCNSSRVDDDSQAGSDAVAAELSMAASADRGSAGQVR